MVYIANRGDQVMCKFLPGFSRLYTYTHSYNCVRVNTHAYVFSYILVVLWLFYSYISFFGSLFFIHDTFVL